MSVNSKMTAIADAIRGKTGESGTLTLDAMATAIAGIESGGGGFPNGTEWYQSNLTSVGFSEVCFENGLWVGFCSTSYTKNGIYYSTDGMTWTQSNVTSGGFYGGGYAKDRWWAARNSNNVYYSTDGMTWTQAAMSFTAYNIAYANGLFVAGTQSGMWYSTDGMTWTQSNVTSGSYMVYNLDCRWFAIGQNGIYYSTDGMTWTQSNVTNSFYSQGIAYANGLFVAGTYTNGMWYSTDGMTWTQSNVTSGGCMALCAANGMWIAGHSTTGSKLYYSTDGMTWTQSNVTGSFYSARNANGIWVVSGGGYGIYYSTDGMTWTQGLYANERSFRNIIAANGMWVASSVFYNGCAVYYSPTWLPS